MERFLAILLTVAGIMSGIILGQATARPAVITLPDTRVAAAAATAPLAPSPTPAAPADDKLTTYQRGQLLAECFKAAPSGQIVLHCIEVINKLP